jgi:hypothetical protein
MIPISEHNLQHYAIIEPKRQRTMTQSLQNHTHSPLIGLIFEENGQEVVRYFTEEKAADAAVTRSTTQKALGVIGAWSEVVPKFWTDS